VDALELFDAVDVPINEDMAKERLRIALENVVEAIEAIGGEKEVLIDGDRLELVMAGVYVGGRMAPSATFLLTELVRIALDIARIDDGLRSVVINMLSNYVNVLVVPQGTCRHRE